MEKSEIKVNILEILGILFQNSGVDTDVLEYVDLIDDLGMDSVNFIALIIELEAEFDIQIPDDMLLLENFKCVDDIVSVIENELSNKSERTEVIENVEA